MSRDLTRAAWADSQGLHIYDFGLDRIELLDEAQPATQYLGISWNDEGTAVAAFRVQGGSADLVVSQDLLTPHSQTNTYRGDSLPSGYEFATGAIKQSFQTFDPAPSPIVWREDGVDLFVNLKGPTPRMASTPANLIVWNWQDPNTPDQNLLPPNYLAYVDSTTRTVRPLANSEVPEAIAQRRGAWVLARDKSPYRHDTLHPRSDYYAIELATGLRHRVVEGHIDLDGTLPRLSPDGAFAVFSDRGDVVSIDMSTDQQRVIGRAACPRNGRHMPAAGAIVDRTPQWQGWSEDGQYVLVSDTYDVWALPLRGGEPLNLTRVGRSRGTTYSRTDLAFSPFGLLTRASEVVNLSAPVFFSYQTRDGHTGLAVRNPIIASMEDLYNADAELTYIRATQANVTYVREARNDRRERYSIAENWHPSHLLFDAATINNSRVSPGIYLSYESAHGAPLAATLHLPFDAQPGHTYPTVVWVYERQALPNRFWTEDTVYGPFLRNGYAVLLPDVIPRVNEPGQTALEHITAAVDAAVATGFVDRSRMALVGHSYGGYETYYVATHSNIFQAAIPMAGVTDLVSWYGALYSPQQNPVFSWSNHYRGNGQTYMSGAWWDHWGDYLRNSPLFSARGLNTPLLMIHGDHDEAAPFENAFEMFGALHALGDHPAVLLQYVGANHGDIYPSETTETGRDVTERMLAFLDHFLKGRPAPDWWENGFSVAPAHGHAQPHDPPSP